MKDFIKTSLISGFLLVLCAMSSAQESAPLKASDEGRLSFVSEMSFWKGKPVELTGRLTFPERGESKWPAVIIFHGSAGQGYRDRSWARYLLENGFATFEVDYLSGRGLRRATKEGPADPFDVIGSFSFLTRHPRIDPNRVALLGFSRGGSIVISSRNHFEVAQDKPRPKAYVGLYPGCERLSITSASPKEPMLIMVGDDDNLSKSSVCEDAARRNRREPNEVQVIVFPGATHAFDDDMAGTVNFGGISVTIRPAPELARQAQIKAAEFLKQEFGR